MQKWNGSLLRKFDDTVDGNASVGTTVVVRNTVGGTLAVVFDVDDINSIQKNNPFVTDDFGRYSFYAPNGKYTIEFGDGSDSIEIVLVDNITHSGLAGLNDAGGHDAIYTRKFNNIPDLYNGIDSSGSTVFYSGMVGVTVEWMGYYSPFDGGGNRGTIKAGTITDDGGSLLQVSTGYYIEADFSNGAYFEQFGASVSANNNETFYNNAYNSGVKNLKSIQWRTYNFSKPVYVTNNTVTEMYNTTLRLADGAATGFSANALFKNKDTVSPTNIKLFGGYFDGNKQNQATSYEGEISGLRMHGASNPIDGLTMRVMEFSNWTSTGYLICATDLSIDTITANNNSMIGHYIGASSYGITKGSISNLRGKDNADTHYLSLGVDNAFFDGVEDSTIDSLYFSYVDVTVGGSGAKFSLCNNNVIDTIYCKNSYWQGLHLNASSGNSISNLVATGSVNNGLQITGNSQGNSITAYKLNDNSEYGCQIQSGGGNARANRLNGGEMLGNIKECLITDASETELRNTHLGGRPTANTGVPAVNLWRLNGSSVAFTNIIMTGNVFTYCLSGINSNVGINTVDHTNSIFNNEYVQVTEKGSTKNIEGWITPTLEGAWVNEASRPVVKYKKKGNTVYIRGTATGGAGGTALFYLPVGYRPSQRLDFNVNGSALSFYRVAILETDGVVIVTTIPSGYVTLNLEFTTN